MVLRFLLLSLLFGAGLSLPKTDTEYFKIKAYEAFEVDYPVQEFFSLFTTGRFASVCLNLTTTSPVTVLAGGCDLYVKLGSFSSGIVQLNRSVIEAALDYDEEQECTGNVQIRLVAGASSVKGMANIFKCNCLYERIPANVVQEMPVNTLICRTSTETWADRMTSHRFRLSNGEVDRRPLRMDQAMGAVAVHFSRTLCFEYRGEGFIKVVLNKCPEGKNVTVLLNTDVIYGLDIDTKEDVNQILDEKCENLNEEMFMEIVPTTKDTVAGVIDMFQCEREYYEGDNSQVAFPDYTIDTSLMANSRQFYLKMKPFSKKTYSADFAAMINTVSIDPKKQSSIRLKGYCENPVTLSLSRCKDGLSRIVIAENLKEDTIMFNTTEVQKFQTLLQSTKCNEFESDDALYLHVKSGPKAIYGSLDFSLVYGTKELSPLIRSAISFNLTANQRYVKTIDLEFMIDGELAKEDSMFGFQLNTTNNVAIYVSKCREGTRVRIGGSTTHRIYKLIRPLVEGIQKVMIEKCPNMENVGSSTGYLHIESIYGPATGTVEFARLKYIDKRYIPFVPFVGPTPEYKGSDKNLQIVVPVQKSLMPTEVDLKKFVYTSLRFSHIEMEVEISKKETVNIIFSRCADGSGNKTSILVNGQKVLSLLEMENIYKVLKSIKCDNKALYGLFVQAEDPSFNGTITIKMENFREKIPNNGQKYFIDNGKTPITVKIPISNFNRSIGIRVSNTQNKPVLMSLSMCSATYKPTVLWHKKLTMANVKYSPARLHKLRKMTGPCPNPEDEAFMYLSVQSERATGKIHVDKTAFESCDRHDCKTGRFQYFPEAFPRRYSQRWIIAEC